MSQFSIRPSGSTSLISKHIRPEHRIGQASRALRQLDEEHDPQDFVGRGMGLAGQRITGGLLKGSTKTASKTVKITYRYGAKPIVKFGVGKPLKYAGKGVAKGGRYVVRKGANYAYKKYVRMVQRMPQTARKVKLALKNSQQAIRMAGKAISTAVRSVIAVLKAIGTSIASLPAVLPVLVTMMICLVVVSILPTFLTNWLFYAKVSEETAGQYEVNDDYHPRFTTAKDAVLFLQSGRFDDYPSDWKAIGKEIFSKEPPPQRANPATQYFYGNCTDFAFWRVNKMMGATKQPWKYTRNNLTPGGAGSGNGENWGKGLPGWQTISDPSQAKYGDIVSFVRGTEGHDSYGGHVAVVYGVVGSELVTENYGAGKYYAESIPLSRVKGHISSGKIVIKRNPEFRGVPGGRPAMARGKHPPGGGPAGRSWKGPSRGSAMTAVGLKGVPNQYRQHIMRAGSICSEITPALIASQLYAESGFRATATSHAGAQGIAQFMPGTWRTKGKDGDGDGKADINNPADAIFSQGHLMCEHITAAKRLIGAGQAQGDILDLALAAYNAGPDKVQKHGGVPPFKETRNYIAKIKRDVNRFAESVSAPVAPPRNETGWTAPSSINTDPGSIAAIALTGEGRPYVAKGTTPNGWDCSGFTQWVYKQKGINIPRTSGGQRNAGRRVSASEARPGDLVWWPGHVGIYLGNGQHIAARNPASGTKIGPVYGSPEYIRIG